jgi:hypothetical protein
MIWRKFKPENAGPLGSLDLAGADLRLQSRQIKALEKSPDPNPLGGYEQV